MGLWAIISGDSNDFTDKYTRSALGTLKFVRKDMRGKRKRKNINLDVVRPKEAERLKLYIKGISEQGGLEKHKYALAGRQVTCFPT